MKMTVKSVIMLLVIVAVVSAAGCVGNTKPVVNETVAPTPVETPVTNDNVTENNSTQVNANVETKQIVTPEDSGKSISLKNGETFTLKLKENPGFTGYSWELNMSKGLIILSEEYENQNPPDMYDGPLTRLLVIKAVNQGSQQVKGVYKNPQENVTGTEINFTINVEVI